MAGQMEQTIIIYLTPIHVIPGGLLVFVVGYDPLMHSQEINPEFLRSLFITEEVYDRLMVEMMKTFFIICRLEKLSDIF